MTEPAKVATAAELEAESTKLVTVKDKTFRIRRVDVAELAALRTRPPKIVKRSETAVPDLEESQNAELRLAQAIVCAGLVEPPVWGGKEPDKPAGSVMPYTLAPYTVALSVEIMQFSDHAPEVAAAASFRDRGGDGPRSGDAGEGGGEVARRGAASATR